MALDQPENSPKEQIGCMLMALIAIFAVLLVIGVIGKMPYLLLAALFVAAIATGVYLAGRVR